MPLSFGSINLLGCLTELRNILLARSPVYYKRMKIKNSYMKEMDRKGKREGARSTEHGASKLPPGVPLSQHLHVFTNPEAPLTHSLDMFVEASSYRHN